MLLFSTLLEINDTMTKDSFIQLVLEWNQGSPHGENIIQGMVIRSIYIVHTMELMLFCLKRLFVV